jgi:DNA-binding transcriptional MerR regulator
MPADLLKIGQVAGLLEVQSHVIRYWEDELPLPLRTRTRGNQRLYSQEDLAVLQRVKELVVERGMSVRKLKRIIQTQGWPEVALAGVQEAFPGLEPTQPLVLEPVAEGLPGVTAPGSREEQEARERLLKEIVDELKDIATLLA